MHVDLHSSRSSHQSATTAIAIPHPTSPPAAISSLIARTSPLSTPQSHRTSVMNSPVTRSGDSAHKHRHSNHTGELGSSKMSRPVQRTVSRYAFHTPPSQNTDNQYQQSIAGASRRYRTSSSRGVRPSLPVDPFGQTQTVSYRFDREEIAIAIDEAIADRPATGSSSSSSTVSCLVCGHTFSSQGNLNRHHRTRHLKERVFCDEPGCGQSFSQAADLRRHKRRLHSV